MSYFAEIYTPVIHIKMLTNQVDISVKTKIYVGTETIFGLQFKDKYKILWFISDFTFKQFILLVLITGIRPDIQFNLPDIRKNGANFE